ncbi:UDP-4-amino-4,6-dideoxy-N-acetyl-beta-L-altrosamine transaminase [Evansella cellulosilytica]|uniref:UDP-4-keto-6-deoxy-N-acetylglucosamine 4-aminotransferase n=1 Tax=Evansella cellulosilytica (strain ATCC 21833 / DSM 2522 / FERM P-1141 / JCM 9156 / N-4) TaxID=649639 RepID=E6TS75_EVAC2|nr:UDP-4-amino-4,6-dideoxy-N-acetyl-beta-L-altrosamine transaminase [Evansella cellulosilytica]ADU31844.1 UDP-4-keto-6-deoxy-N-acetylglucosamine 4-aminotransferase [Evansella cellulosilytica DSM 2522]
MLAIHGGKPVRDSFLSYGKQYIDDEDINAVIEVLKSPFLTQGPAVERFEDAVAKYVGAKHAVAFANGTAALHGAYYAAGVTKGDEIITPAMTFAATVNAALYQGARPVFSDIDKDTYNLDPKKIEDKITERTKAIVSVDYTGQPVDYHSFQKLAKKHHLVFISDGAHSLGATFEGRKVGKQADMTMFSFHPVKPVTTGEGGIVVTDNSVYANQLRLFRSHGITKTEVSEKEGPWFYEMVELGMNYRMNDIQAALGTSQLRKIDEFILKRKKISEQYTTRFQKIPGLITPKQLNHTESGWHLYILQLDLSCFSVGRKEIFEALRAENIGVHVHYIPVYKHPYYRKLGYTSMKTPITEEIYEGIITLPIFPTMTKKDVEDVITSVLKVISEYKIK